MINIAGIKCNLAEYVECRKQEYEGKPSWMWEDEGLIYAIQDYESSCPYADWDEEDKQYLKDNNLEEVITLFN